MRATGLRAAPRLSRTAIDETNHQASVITWCNPIRQPRVQFLLSFWTTTTETGGVADLVDYGGNTSRLCDLRNRVTESSAPKPLLRAVSAFGVCLNAAIGCEANAISFAGSLPPRAGGADSEIVMVVVHFDLAWRRDGCDRSRHRFLLGIVRTVVLRLIRRRPRPGAAVTGKGSGMDIGKRCGGEKADHDP